MAERMKRKRKKVITSGRPILGARYGLHWAHAAPGGGPVLRNEASWRTISGLLVNTPRGAVWLFFRRGSY